MYTPVPQPGGSTRDSLGDLTWFQIRGDRQCGYKSVSVPPRGCEKSWPSLLLLVSTRDPRTARLFLPGQHQAAGEGRQRAECWLNSAQPWVSVTDPSPQAREVSLQDQELGCWDLSKHLPLSHMHATILVVMSDREEEA